MALDLEHIERELKNRHSFPYAWFQKQNDLWDTATRFIYKTTTWKQVLETIQSTQRQHHFDKASYFQYAANRWYNFWSAQAVESLFTSLPGIVANPKPLQDHYDFKWLGIPIDHKTSVFPKGYGKDFAFAKAHKETVIHWFYNHQSKGQRYHLNNRLFIVVHDQNGAHWKLKAEINLLRQAIEPYAKNNTPAIMETLVLEEGKVTLADIIWVER